jgi:hypothetical protein
MKHGCNDCKYCKCYKGDSWTPDDYECVGLDRTDTTVDISQETFDRVWVDGKEWNDKEEPICPLYEEADLMW